MVYLPPFTRDWQKIEESHFVFSEWTAYMLVIIWAFVGIAVKHADVPVVATGAWVTTALVGLMLIIGAFVLRRGKQPLKSAG